MATRAVMSVAGHQPVQRADGITGGFQLAIGDAHFDERGAQRHARRHIELPGGKLRGPLQVHAGLAQRATPRQQRAVHEPRQRRVRARGLGRGGERQRTGQIVLRGTRFGDADVCSQQRGIRRVRRPIVLFGARRLAQRELGMAQIQADALGLQRRIAAEPLDDFLVAAIGQIHAHRDLRGALRLEIRRHLAHFALRDARVAQPQRALGELQPRAMQAGVVLERVARLEHGAPMVALGGEAARALVARLGADEVITARG
jgi:hypothetical protein